MWSYSSCAKLHQKVQCSHGLLYWNQGIVYCTCGQCLIYSELDALSIFIPNYVIEKSATNGARHGKTKVPRKYHQAWNAWKRVANSQGEHFTSIHDRFLRDSAYRESQLANRWTEQKVQRDGRICKRRPCVSSLSKEYRRYQGQWDLILKNKQNGLIKFRSDFRAAVLMKNRLHHESGEQIEVTFHRGQCSRRHHSASLFKHIVVGQV